MPQLKRLQGVRTRIPWLSSLLARSLHSPPPSIFGSLVLWSLALESVRSETPAPADRPGTLLGEKSAWRRL